MVCFDIFSASFSSRRMWYIPAATTIITVPCVWDIVAYAYHSVCLRICVFGICYLDVLHGSICQDFWVYLCSCISFGYLSSTALQIESYVWWMIMIFTLLVRLLTSTVCLAGNALLAKTRHKHKTLMYYFANWDSRGVAVIQTCWLLHFAIIEYRL